jgi:hypothetical protein
VSISVSLLGKFQPTETARIRLFTFVHAQMIFHVAQFFELSIAVHTGKCLVQSSGLWICHVATLESVNLGAFPHNLVLAFPTKFQIFLLGCRNNLLLGFLFCSIFLHCEHLFTLSSTLTGLEALG